MPTFSRKIAVAPMMDWTDRHFRYLIRLLSKHTLLYTEMVTTGAILHGDQQRLLRYHPAEHPVALQLGGSDPVALEQCTRLADTLGYDEINLNVGCPSDRVQSGRFGACLMKDPLLVQDCCQAMRAATTKPVTIKCRIGVDEQADYPHFRDFISGIASVGINVFIVHARKAWLKGLSPKQNREIPPLQYDYVRRLKSEFPHLTIILNGGIQHHSELTEAFATLDGIMLGRAAYHDPYQFATVDKTLFGEGAVLSRTELVEAYVEYAKQQVAQGEPCQRLLRHSFGLFRDCPGAKQWRQYLSQFNRRNPATPDVLLDGLAAIYQSN